MMRHKNFAVFILSHGRAGNVFTYNSLIKSGYTGKIYILIDNEDKTADQYYKNFSDKVIMFDKRAEAEQTNTMDNFEGRKAIVYARNANFKIAKDLGLKYFLQLDDDYKLFEYRINQNLEYPKEHFITRKYLNNVFDLYLDLLISTNAKAIAMAQGGDFIGGANSGFIGKMKRKCMNTWFMSVDKPINFTGRMNEDYTTSVYNGFLGDLFFTIPFTSILQEISQRGAGGMTDLYLDNGTYVKTFYSIMALPSAVKVSILAGTGRLHHVTNWNNAAPKIINESHKIKAVNTTNSLQI